MTKRITAVAAATLLFFAATSGAALAAGNANVVVPWGDWLSAAITAAWGFFGSIIVGFVYGLISTPVKRWLSERILGDILAQVVAQTAGAVAGRTATVAIVNVLLNRAATQFIATEPKLAAWLADGLKPMLLAMLARLGMVPAEAHDDPADDPQALLDMGTPSHEEARLAYATRRYK